jgi:hypothetical protein
LDVSLLEVVMVVDVGSSHASLAPLPTDRHLTGDEMVAASKHYTMYSWSAGDSVDPIPFVRGERVWLYDANGKRWLDWNSQAMSVHVGHGHPKIFPSCGRSMTGGNRMRRKGGTASSPADNPVLSCRIGAAWVKLMAKMTHFV